MTGGHDSHLVQDDPLRSLPAGVDGATAYETPVTFPGQGEELFGIVTAPPPAARARGVGVVLLNGGACTPSTGRNRFSVKLARRLAALGFHVLRFDYHGVGESTGTVVRYNLNRPFTHDMVAAVSELSRRGISRVILVGRCFGARTALSALQHVTGATGVAFISMPLHRFSPQEQSPQEQLPQRAGRWALVGLIDPARRRRYLRTLYYSVKKVGEQIRALSRNGAGSAQSWISPDVVRWLDGAVARRIPLLFLYGIGEDYCQEFARAESDVVGTLLQRAGAGAQVVTLDGPVHDLTTIQVQEAIIGQILAWADSLTASEPGRGIVHEPARREDGARA